MTAAARLPPLVWPFQGAEEEELGPAEGADQQGGDSHAHGRKTLQGMELTMDLWYL